MSDLPRYVCVHGHFYQPPRENPWLDEVEVQDSAQPYHDWNERITAECYAPNAHARILDGEGLIENIVNNYARISFNFGPTLLAWLERKRPAIHEAIVHADHISRRLFSGHGSALAQIFNHMIMPLATERDRRVQLAWGLEDFRRRFGREAEGIWLPETAVDLLTLDLLAEAGLAFTILAPRQAARVRRLGEEEWRDVSDGRVDPTTPYVQRLPSGRTIALFFYDGPISQDLAFAGLLKSGEALADRLMSAFTEPGANGRDWPQLSHIATDGESYGHHHSQGEMALAYALSVIERDPSVSLTNYGEYLERHPPTMEVEIFENSSWSCIHGVERWRTDCGCNSGMKPHWHQKWRAPLREAVTRLGERLDAILGEKGGSLFKDPFAAREAMIEIIEDHAPENVNRFLTEHARRPLAAHEVVTALKLLEMARFGQLIFTSCAWFFDEVSGIETVQVMQYAARAMQLAQDLTGQDLEPEFREILRGAPSNVLESGAKAYDEYAKPARVDLPRVAAHYAMAATFGLVGEEHRLGAYAVRAEKMDRRTAGRSSLCTGTARMTALATREETEVQFAVLHAGDHNLACGVAPLVGDKGFLAMRSELAETFERGDLAESIRRLDAHFEGHGYSVRDLFRDGQREVVRAMLKPSYASAETILRRMHEDNVPLLNFLGWLSIPPPRHMAEAARFVIRTDLKRLFRSREIDVRRLGELLDEAQRRGVDLGGEKLGLLAAGWLARKVEKFAADPLDMEHLAKLREAREHLSRLSLGLLQWRAQNVWFDLNQGLRPEMGDKAAQGDATAAAWCAAFDDLGRLLGMRTA